MSLVLGLEVTTRVVRGAFLRTALRGSEMEQYAEAPLPYSADSGLEADVLQTAIAQVLAEGVRPPDRIIASLNGEAASLRLIDLPAGVEKKAGEVLPGELGSVLPFDIDDAIVDYQVVDRSESTIQLMAVAAPRRNVAERLEELRSAGVDPSELAVGAAAFDGLGALLGESLQDKTVIVIDVGPENTDFAALTHGRCTFARTLSGGMDLVESGRRAQLGAALQRTLASYRAQRAEEPSMVLLSGETAPMESARSWLTEQLGIACGVAPLPAAPGADEETRPKFAKAAALASRAISRRKQLNLRQGEFASAAAAGELRKHARLIAVCFAAVILAFGVSLLARYRVARAEQERLTGTLAEVSKDLLGEETRSALHAREILTAGPRIDDPLPRFDAYDVLEAISESIPADIQHDTRRLLIEIDDDGDNGRFEIQGTVGSIAERDRLVDDLQAHACFAEAEKGSISNAVGDRKDYKLVVKVDCEEAVARPKKKER
ncbi:MAG: pilus assembly protein PilM [Myxococcales bacterium]|nr:pilus assembly protein PilM [Myxococcales bacterium]